MKLSSISFYSRGKSSLPLLNDVKLTSKTPSRPKRSYQSSNKNNESHSKNRIDVVETQMVLFATDLKNKWLPKFVYSDRIYPQI